MYVKVIRPTDQSGFAPEVVEGAVEIQTQQSGALWVKVSDREGTIFAPGAWLKAYYEEEL